MKEIPLTRGYVALVDDEDYNWLNQWKWCADGNGYATRSVGGKRTQKKLYMHRLVNKTPEGLQTDHINRNRCDNRKENLKAVTPKENQQNKPSTTETRCPIKYAQGMRRGFVKKENKKAANNALLAYMTRLFWLLKQA